MGELGEGGMGVVYKARQVRLNRFVALKMIMARGAGGEALARFRSEAEAIAQLRHPNIIQIYEIGECATGPYFAMDLAEGGSLADRWAGCGKRRRASRSACRCGTLPRSRRSPLAPTAGSSSQAPATTPPGCRRPPPASRWEHRCRTARKSTPSASPPTAGGSSR
jgi:hypothetical protein